MLWAKLQAAERVGGRPITHVIGCLRPPWILPDQFLYLAIAYPDITFVQLNHSGCAYLIDR